MNFIKHLQGCGMDSSDSGQILDATFAKTVRKFWVAKNAENFLSSCDDTNFLGGAPLYRIS
jgi:hypothetical protein